MHSEQVQLSPLDDKQTLKHDIADFKSIMRKIATHCLKEEEEWLLSTCYGRANRLQQAAVGNKHAAVKGMPMIPDDEASHIMKTILVMKGAQSKKSRIAHEKGELRLHRRPLTYRGTAKHWHKEMAKHEN